MNKWMLCVVCLLACSLALADRKISRSGGVNDTYKFVRVWTDPVTGSDELSFTGSNSAWIETSRATGILCTNAFSFTLEGEGPDGSAFAIEDFNGNAAMSISAGHCKSLGVAIFPYNRIRLVKTAGNETGVYVMGAD